jgi:hypothetical protein
MKPLRITSYILLGLILIALILGNLFYSSIRKIADPNYSPLEMAQKELSKINQNNNPDYKMELYTDKNAYHKYEKIKVFARIIRNKDRKIQENSVIEVEFYLNGERLKSLSGNEKIKLIYNASEKCWAGYWYPYNMSIAGNIELKAAGFPDMPEGPVTAENQIYIDDLKPKFSLKKGSAFIGIDSLERISKRNIISVEGKEVDWSYIPEWLNFISADGILMLGGITKTFQEETTLDSPWDNDKINETIMLAERLKQKGKSFGAWINCLKVEGINTKKIGFKTGLALNGDKYSENNSVISILDENRKKNIIKLASSFIENNSFSYVGLSDIFLSPEQNLELIDQFVKEFEINIPQNWEGLNFDAKFVFISNLLKDKNLFSQFLAWKNYAVAEYLRDIIEESGHKKPFFYMMDYLYLLENPSSVSAIINSGVDFIVLDFNISYDRIKEVIDLFSKDSKIAPFFNRIVVSCYIDYKNMDVNGFELSAIENYVKANLELAKQGSDILNANGILINDLYKAMFGKRGPYSPYDWMLAIGETVYRFKEMNNAAPLDVRFSVPHIVHAGESFLAQIDIGNYSSKTIENLKIDFLPISGKNSQKSVSLNNIAAGKQLFLSIPIELETNSFQFVRKKNFLGIRFSWSDPDDKNSSKPRSFVTLQSVDLSERIGSTNTITNK